MIHRYAVEVAGQEHQLSVEPLDEGRFRITRNGVSRIVDARQVQSDGAAATWSLVPEGGGPTALVDVDGRAPELTVTAFGVTLPIRLQSPLRRVAARAGSAKAIPATIRSPMPGKVVRLLVAVGDAVQAGQGVAVVEAMKMENELRSPRDGRVKEVPVKEGQAVEAGQMLAVLE